MTGAADFRSKTLALNHGGRRMPALGFGTLIPDAATTISATRDALKAGYRHFKLRPLYEAARIKPSVVQIEAHPYLPETELLEFCKEHGIVFLAFAPLGHGIRPGPLEDPVIAQIAARTGMTPAQVLLAWAIQRGGALLTTPKTEARARANFDVSALPADAFDEINRIETRQRFNEVVKTGSPGFIPRWT